VKPHKRNGRVAKLRRQESAKDRADKGRVLLKKIFSKEEENK
jgi:hypothetical protein